MAEAPPFPKPVPRERSPVPVKVKEVDHLGNIKLEPAKHAFLRMPLPEYVKLPLPNSEAHKLVNSTLSGKPFKWLPKEGETMEYNIFLDADKNNVTHALYKEIVCMLDKAIGLPEVHDTGTCRISPIYDPKQLYVQPQPAFVDTISYAIYLTLQYWKSKGIYKPAADVVIGETYILADGYKNCRVKLEKRISSPEPSSFKELAEGRVSPERETTISARCIPVEEYENGCVGNDSVCGNGGGDLNVSIGGSKDTSYGIGEESEEDQEWELLKLTEQESQWELIKRSEAIPFHRAYGEEVEVFRIDYGGENITVHRADLYDVESVCPALKTLEKLAFPVNVGYIDNSPDEKDARIKDLRKKQEIIKVKTMFRGPADSPVLVDLFHAN